MPESSSTRDYDGLSHSFTSNCRSKAPGCFRSDTVARTKSSDYACLSWRVLAIKYHEYFTTI
eukprot:6214805-Pleurochrysis_carterae.AAC.11